ncbi:MAG: IS3 family transposase [Clostridia bacterium]|nr:IS3 family transposase [Clostridia bacterium]MBP3932074.1 IS3 family transposase [Peptostreptococcaceae bacterium]MBQ8902148.1 IS3 family transposase [Bacilli bacterium]
MISKSNIFRTIHQLKSKYNISTLCKIGKVSRSGYYKWLNSNIVNDKDLDLKYKILKIYNDSKKVYGYRRIKIGLFRAYGLIVNHKKIIRLMKSLNIHSVIRRKRFKYYAPKTIDIGRVEPNLLNREFNCNSPNQKWVTDITYLKYDNGRKRMYLSAIEDLYNREIIAYKISDNLDMSFVENTLGEAFKKVSTGEFRNLIIHSDQGVHYKSNIYKSILKKFGVRQSMSRKGNCYDNACIENFFGHLKTELIYQNSYNSKEELVKSINDYIYWYNNYRFQAKLKNMTPVEYRCHMIS